MLRGSFTIAAMVACLLSVPTLVLASDYPIPRQLTSYDLLSLRQIGGEFGALSVAPNQQSVAFQVVEPRIAKGDYGLSWFVAELGGQRNVTRVAAGGEVMLGPGVFGRVNGHIADVKAAWSPDSKWIAYLRKDKGEIQVWGALADGSAERQLTRTEADVLDFTWSKDATLIYYTIGSTREEIKRTKLAEGEKGFVLDDRFAPGYSPEPLSPDCRQASWDNVDPTRQPCVLQVRVAALDGGERTATHEEVQALDRSDGSKPMRRTRPIRNATLDSGGRHWAWLENENPDDNPGFAPPMTVYASGKRCAVPECQGLLHHLWWIGKEVVFLRNEGHASATRSLYAWRPGASNSRPIYRTSGYLDGCESAGTWLICLYEAPENPRKIVALDVRRGTLATIYDPNPEFHSFKLGKVERIEWRDAFGNETFGHLIYPSDYQGERPYPLVIVQYRSRGFLSGGVGNEYPIFPLAEQGFLVLSFDRPEDRSMDARFPINTLAEIATLQGVAWKDAYTQRQALTALEEIIARLSRRGLISDRRVGITGLSDGATTVDYALTHSKSFAAAALSGTASPTHYYSEVNDAMRLIFRGQFLATSGPDVLRNWGGISMITRAHEVEAPLLIQVSDRELVPTVPLFIALKDAGKSVDAYVFPDEYHIKWQPQHKLAVAERTVDWFRFWLKDEEDAAYEKRVQYARWRKLRTDRHGE